MTRLELEKALEQRCVDKVEARGGLALKLRPPTGKGFPDRVVLMPRRARGTSDTNTVYISSASGGYYPARVFFLELKRQKTGVESTQQATWRRMLTLLGFGVYMIDDDEQFDAALERELGR